MTEINLRDWQSTAIRKAMYWFAEEKSDRRFLLNVAPGAGKTICACVIAKELLDRKEIERVVVIAPRTEVVRQWAQEFKRVTGKYMLKISGAGAAIADSGVDVCATWQAIESLEDAFQILCRNHETLVICDEYHHAAIEASWGIGANKSFEDAKYRLLLSGTPIRTDRAKTVAHDDEGTIAISEGGTYSLTYGEAVNLKYCRPATFHRHAGTFDVVLPDKEKITVSSKNEGNFPSKIFDRIEGLKEALNFYKLACTTKYEEDGKTPDINSYQATMLKAGIEKLNEAREILPTAGGLVIARNIKTADYMKKLLEMMDEKPIIVHSETPNPEENIAQFKNTVKRWIVSVGMISEGVDIPRLRVLVYLPSSKTELTFRQSMGRVVRTFGHDDISHAYVVMPSILTFEDYAFRVEEEMRAFGVQEEIDKLKVCPKCENRCPKKAKACEYCDYEFPVRPLVFKECPECKIKNVSSTTICQNCGYEFTLNYKFEIALRDALREGAIIRGMYVDEDTVQIGEKMKNEFRERVKDSGNPALLDIITSLPPEAYGKLVEIVNTKTKDSEHNSGEND